MTDWQPIETAPKDQRERILLYEEWSGNIWTGQRYNETLFTNDEGFTMRNPTHWMPFPPPPSMAAQSEEKEDGPVLDDLSNAGRSGDRCADNGADGAQREASAELVAPPPVESMEERLRERIWDLHAEGKKLRERMALLEERHAEDLDKIASLRATAKAEGKS